MPEVPLLPAGDISPAARAMLDQVILGYAGYETDTPRRLAALLDAEPDMGLAHIVRGYFLMLNFKLANVPAAREALDTARKHIGGDLAWALAHAAALEHWIAGDLDRTLAVWEQILAEHPRDILAFRLHHFNNFWLGRPQRDARVGRARAAAMGADMPGYGTMLGLPLLSRIEECGDYPSRKPPGAPRPSRSTPAMSGPRMPWRTCWRCRAAATRASRGSTAWSGNWDGANNLHASSVVAPRRCIISSAASSTGRARSLRPALPQSRLAADPGAAGSLHRRAERRLDAVPPASGIGIDVGNRWDEIADKAEARIGDCLSAFTLPHWMMALAAAGRWRRGGAHARCDARLRRAGDGHRGAAGGRLRAAGLRGRAGASHAANTSDAVELMRPALGGMYRLGGSHAQQDVLEQLFLDCAVKAGAPGRHPAGPRPRAHGPSGAAGRPHRLSAGGGSLMARARTTAATAGKSQRKPSGRARGKPAAPAVPAQDASGRKPLPPHCAQVGLVLQGGGALGAYQAGVYEALAEGGNEPDWVAGISIGAINAAIIAGNPPERRRGAAARVLGAITDRHRAASRWSTARWRAALVQRLAARSPAPPSGVPGFFRRACRRRWLQPRRHAGALSFYDTAPLRGDAGAAGRLRPHQRGRNAASASARSMSAPATSVYFDNATSARIGPEHIMASGALPPGFPPIEIDGEHYWDGGIVSNTPLQYVLDARLESSMLVFQVDLFSARGALPRNLLDVDERHKDIRYSSRTRLNTDAARAPRRVCGARIERLIEKLPAQLRRRPRRPL